MPCWPVILKLLQKATKLFHNPWAHVNIEYSFTTKRRLIHQSKRTVKWPFPTHQHHAGQPLNCLNRIFLLYLICSPSAIPCYYAAMYSSAHPAESLVEICMYSLITIASLVLELTCNLLLIKINSSTQLYQFFLRKISWLYYHFHPKTKHGHSNFLDIRLAAMHQHSHSSNSWTVNKQGFSSFPCLYVHKLKTRKTNTKPSHHLI